MERNVEQLAWTVLIAAFCVFCLLVVAIPTGVNWYLAQAMADRPVRLEVIKGTALWLPAGGRQEVNAASHPTVGRGEQVRTAADSEALLSFFDGSNVRLWPNTTIRVLDARSSAHRQADTELVLAQDAGHARYEVAIPATEARHFEVITPQASTLLREGSYRVEVREEQTAVTVTSGSATVSGGHSAVEVLRGEWVQVAAEATPTRPEPALHTIIANGEFTHGFDHWQPGVRAEVGDTQEGVVTTRDQDNRTFVEFARDPAQRHAETFLHQAVNQDVTDFALLKLAFQLRVLAQTSLSDGGLASEYPLAVRVHYRDSTGSETTWTRGFYVQDSPDDVRRDAQPVAPSLWTDVTFDLFDPGVVSPRPSEILWIEFAAAGLTYQSNLGNVQLLAY